VTTLLLVLLAVQASPAEKLFHDVQAKLAAAHTMHVREVTFEMGQERYEMEVNAKKPNLYRFDTAPTANGKNAQFSDGNSMYTIQDGQYGVLKEFRAGAMAGPGLDAFFASDLKWQVTNKEPTEVDFLDKRALAIDLQLGTTEAWKCRLMIDAKTNLPEGFTHEFHQGTRYVQYVDLRLDGPIDDGLFVPNIEAVTKATTRPNPFEAKLIPVGATVPGFTAYTPWGDEVTPASAVSGKKALILNFWFYG